MILAAALTGGISLNSCIDLDPVDYSDINPSNFPQTETDIQSMVNSCYYSVRSSWFDGLFSTSERGVTVINDLTTEILSCKSGFLKDVSELNYFSTTADLTRFIIPIPMHIVTVGSMISVVVPLYLLKLKHATS